MAGFNTVKTYALDGSTTTFNVTFDYLARNHIVATIIKTDGTREELSNPSDFTFISATQIETTKAWGPSDNAASIEVKRVTPTDKRVITFQDGSILRSADLNLANIQSIFIAEEARELANEGIGVDINGQLDARNRKILNVAPGVSGTDAVNYNQLFGVQDSAGASARASAASATASAAETVKATTQANNARLSALSAEENARNASASAAAAKASETAAKTSEDNASVFMASAETFAGYAEVFARSGMETYVNTVNEGITIVGNANTEAERAKTEADRSKTEANRSKTEADRAKSEADRISGQNALVDAILGVGPGPAFVADFRSMPTVDGKSLIESSADGGLQINSNIFVDTTGNLNDDTYAGKNFAFAKGATNAPDIQSNIGIVIDVYGYQGQNRQRMQTCYDDGIVHIRQQHMDTGIWDPWVGIGSLDAINLGNTIDLNNLLEAGFFYQGVDANALVSRNYPEVAAGVLISMSSAAGHVQQYTVYANGNTYLRSKKGTSAWGSWAKSYTSLNKPTASDVGAYSQYESDTKFIGLKLLLLQDLNTITTQGMYSQASASNATTARHYPENEAGTLLVTVAGTTVIQEYSTTTSLHKHIRSLENSVWSAWKAIGSDSGGEPVSSVAWVPLRAGMWDGYLPADGQLLSRTLYPDLWKLVESNLVPVVTESAWTGQTFSRGSYTTGDGSTTFRVPDYNGRSAGSLGSVFLRGDGVNSGVVGSIQESSNKSHTHSRGTMNITGDTGWLMGGLQTDVVSGALVLSKIGQAYNPPSGGAGASYRTLELDASRSWTGETSSDGVEESRPVNVAGCWAIKAYGKVLNEGKLDATALQKEFEELKKAVSSDPVLSVVWVQKRDAMWDGYVPADGQEFSRDAYPEAWKAIHQQLVPVVSDFDWKLDATKRGCFTDGDGSTFRVPDYNGKSVGAFGPVYLGGGDATGGTILRDRLQNITSSGGSIIYGDPFTGALGTRRIGTGLQLSGSTNSYGELTFDASRVARTGDTTRPITVEGCWAVKLFGVVKNEGTIDAAGLATQVAAVEGHITSLGTRVTALEGRKSTCLVDNLGTGAPHETESFGLPASILRNSRYVLENPFGINTPVECITEIYAFDKWGQTGWVYSNGGYGAKATYVQGVGIVLQTGGSSLLGTQAQDIGAPFGHTGWNATNAARCRVFVRRFDD